MTSEDANETALIAIAALMCIVALFAIALAEPLRTWQAREIERQAMKECLETGARWDDCRLWVGAEMEMMNERKR